MKATTVKTALLTALSAIALFSPTVHADTLADIKARGTLIVGVKNDYNPFGFVDTSGTIIGVEPDLAADVAKRLGVKLQLVPVNSSNRIAFLKQGKVDMLIATMADSPERRKQLDIIQPPYYADFGNVMLNRNIDAKSWDDLKGKRICATSGSSYNKPVAQNYGVDLVSFDGSDRPLLALKNGDCVGYVFDQAFLFEKLQDASWSKGFKMSLPGIMPSPWVMAAAKDESKWAAYLGDVSKDWARSGTILAEETKWHLHANDFTKKQHDDALAAK
jgi:polar amino acid transport system substrate-binding protein